VDYHRLDVALAVCSCRDASGYMKWKPVPAAREKLTTSLAASELLAMLVLWISTCLISVVHVLGGRLVAFKTPVLLATRMKGIHHVEEGIDDLGGLLLRPHHVHLASFAFTKARFVLLRPPHKSKEPLVPAVSVATSKPRAPTLRHHLQLLSVQAEPV
jgi:hypothetical protein